MTEVCAAVILIGHRIYFQISFKISTDLMHQHSHHHPLIHEQAHRTQIEVLDICFENILDLFCCLTCSYVSPKLPRHGSTAPRGGLCCSCFITAEIEQIMNIHPLHHMHHMQHRPPCEAQFVDQAVVRKEQGVQQKILRRQDLDTGKNSTTI